MSVKMEKVFGKAEKEIKRITDAAEPMLGYRLQGSSSQLEQ